MALIVSYYIRHIGGTGLIIHGECWTILDRLLFVYNTYMGGLILMLFLLGWNLPAAANEASPRQDVALVDPGIPLDALDSDRREKVQSVLNQALFSQTVRGITYRSRPEVLEFLLDHLDFATSIARVLKLGRYRIERRGDGFWGDDGAGATGTFKLLFSDPRRRLYLVRLQYSKPLLPTIEAQLLILLEYDKLTDGNGDPLIEQQVVGYAAPENALTGALAQLVATLSPSSVESSVTKKVRRLFRQVATMTQMATDDPEGLYERLARSPEVTPEPLQAFHELLFAGWPPTWAAAAGPLRLLDPSRLILPDDLR